MMSRSWFGFLQFVVMMKADYRFKTIVQEIRDCCGVTKSYVVKWRVKYQTCSARYLEEADGLQVGQSKEEIIAVDESATTRDMMKTSKPPGFKIKRTRVGSHGKNPNVKARLPGKTLWKKPAMQKKPAQRVLRKPAMLKRPAKKGRVAGTDRDRRSNSNWLWAAVECGQKGGPKKSRKLGNERVAMVLLPRKADAPPTGSRGTESLTIAMNRHIPSGNYIVADDWLATPPAMEAAGSRTYGSADRTENWRNPETEVHSNDAESEFARLKFFLRSKYGWAY